MPKAPESYLDCRRPPLMDALRLEGKADFDEAMKSLEQKGYFTAPPRPWKVCLRGRGLGHGDFGVIDKFGDLVVEMSDYVSDKATAEFIVKAANAYRETNRPRQRK